MTGEEADAVERSISEVITPALSGQDPFTYARLLEDLSPRLGASALAMVDMALYDLMAKQAGVPLYQFLGGYRSRIPTSITITILPLTDTLRKAEQFVADGFGVIKLKGGIDVEEDIAKLRKLRKRYPRLTLRFDANQGYDLEAARHFLQAAKPLRIDIFEQPFPIGAREDTTALMAADGPPIMADESLKTLQDAFHLTRHGLADMVNIKLQKVGGINRGMHINSVARAARKEVMVGCLDESELGIAAGLHFALSRPNIAYADLDGHLDFIKSPFDNDLFSLSRGVLIPNNKAGIGL